MDLFRSRSGRTRQVIRGLRKKEFLPVRDFRYYVDRLTAVQNGFGDRIAIGEGRDVRDVPHPLGKEGEGLYHYRITDSIRVRPHSMPEPIRVYEVEVRPRREDQPAFSGSVFLEAATGAVVRMVFTFTPASYADPRVDWITVRLEHALWEESLWLPHRQVVEVRREVPEMDLPVGSVIRAILEVTDYDFDPELDPGFFRGPAVTLVPYGAADSTAFATGLTDRMAEQGLSPVNAARLEAEVQTAARTHFASGLPRFRLYTDRFSSLLRANRAEGVYFGAGASFSFPDALGIEGLAGYGTGNRKGSATLRVHRSFAADSTAAALELYGRQLRDLGPRPGVAGAINSLSVLLRDRDYTDPYFASGVRLSLEHRMGSDARAWARGVREHFTGATLAWPSDSRPARPAMEGVFTGASGGYTHRWGGRAAWGATATVSGTAGRWEGNGTASLRTWLEGRIADRELSRSLSVAAEAGRSWGNLPPQLLFFVGGPGTLPGHPFRKYGGKAFFLGRGEAALTLIPGWLTGRMVAGAGTAGFTPSTIRKAWGTRPTEGLRGFAGVGLAVFHDLVRIDGAYGFPGGSFEVILSVDPWLWPYL